MICPKCNNYNNDNAKFCRKCGAPLVEDKIETPNVQSESFFEKNKILIICIAIIAIVAAGAGVYLFTMNNDVALQTQNFGAFSMSVPVGSNFVEDSNMDMGIVGGFVTFKNIGEHSDDAYWFDVSSLSSTLTPSEFTLDDKDGDLKIYIAADGSDIYLVERNVNDYDFGLMGSNLDVLKKMANSIKVTGTISNESSSSAPTQTSAPSHSSSSSSPLKILGGSFSTGSELEDKTYAEIYVGANHAGESVVVQIFYSRDGSALNNGNYVPVTVDSNGYISVSSADAYDYFPDYATIKLYDANRNLQDTLSVSLSPSAGTQSF